MKNLVLLLLLGNFSCALGIKKEAMINDEIPVIRSYSDLKDHIGKKVILEGVMLMEKFRDKGGRTHDYYEFWLEMDEKQRVFLRNAGDAISKEPFTRRVHIEGKLFHGNIDSDDPKVQSRVGYRLDFYNIRIIGND